VVEDHSSCHVAHSRWQIDIRTMSKLSIRLLMANDRLHSSLRNDSSIREKQLAAICWLAPKRNAYVQTGPHNGGRGDGDDLVVVVYHGESCGRG